MKSQRWYELPTAQWYLNHFWAGLVYAGRDEDNGEQWIGETKNWTMFTWLDDGVYDDKTKEEKLEIINEYLNK